MGAQPKDAEVPRSTISHPSWVGAEGHLPRGLGCLELRLLASKAVEGQFLLSEAAPGTTSQPVSS